MENLGTFRIYKMDGNENIGKLSRFIGEINENVKVFYDYSVTLGKRYRYVIEAIIKDGEIFTVKDVICLLYTYPSPRDRQKYRMPSSA